MRLIHFTALLSLSAVGASTISACSGESSSSGSAPSVPAASATLLPGGTQTNGAGATDSVPSNELGNGRENTSGAGTTSGSSESEQNLQGTDTANQNQNNQSEGGTSANANSDSMGRSSSDNDAADSDSADSNTGTTTDEDSMQTADEQPTPEEDSVATAGCGNGSQQTGEFTIALGGVNTAYVVTLPNNYDPNVPSPLVFGFHGRGRTHIQFQEVDAGAIENEFGSRAIMVYLKSHEVGNGWNAAEEVEPNVAVFEELFPRVMGSYCVDSSRVFAMGHSSGGFFSNILACRFPERFLGIGSVAGATQECTGKVAAFVAHGIRDTVVDYPRGQGSRDGYLATNGCSANSTPTGVGPCIAYQGCEDGLPVQWCEHNEPTYQDTNHGWPSFASQAMSDFLFSL